MVRALCNGTRKVIGQVRYVAADLFWMRGGKLWPVCVRNRLRLCECEQDFVKSRLSLQQFIFTYTFLSRCLIKGHL